MHKELDLADIQGNILQPYGRQGFPLARCVLLHVNEGREVEAQAFLDRLRRRVTTAELWPSSHARCDQLRAPLTITARKPDVAINVAFTFQGLLALAVPVRTLRSMPDEFQEGMLKRAPILNDRRDSQPGIEQLWDPIWVAELNDRRRCVHVLITLHANASPERHESTEAALEATYQSLASQCGEDRGMTILSGHRGPSDQYQDMATLPQPGKEHFGFADGIGNPVFEGQYPCDEEMRTAVVGQGKLTAGQQWVPLATGEFLLGYADEAQETPGAAMPNDFSRNGTFMAYRKLHQNVNAFHNYIEAKAEVYAAIHAVSQQEASETLRAKMAGRWSDGIPLMHAPTYGQWQAERNAIQDMPEPERTNYLSRVMRNFSYAADADGSRCPFSSHLRRSNPRDMLDPTAGPPKQPGQAPKATSVLNNRRRILRRGLPYGHSGPGISDQEEHGVLMLALCASLFRQFEFVQQQWLQYGHDFQSGNDSCPLVGNHGDQSKFVIEASAKSGKPPFICDQLPQFVEVRGGAYFFVPSMTALRLIAQGLIDPT
jgi:Dyp-type peroxidase family